MAQVAAQRSCKPCGKVRFLLRATYSAGLVYWPGPQPSKLMKRVRFSHPALAVLSLFGRRPIGRTGDFGSSDARSSRAARMAAAGTRKGVWKESGRSLEGRKKESAPGWSNWQDAGL